MGGMMAGAGLMYLWAIVLSLVGLGVVATCGIMCVRVLHARHRGGPQLTASGRSNGLDDAEAALRMRYARGEISREDYLQGKVELED